MSKSKNVEVKFSISTIVPAAVLNKKENFTADASTSLFVPPSYAAHLVALKVASYCNPLDGTQENAGMLKGGRAPAKGKSANSSKDEPDASLVINEGEPTAPAIEAGEKDPYGSDKQGLPLADGA